MDVGYTYCGDRFTTYTRIKSCCVTKTNTLYVDYASVTLRRGFDCDPQRTLFKWMLSVTGLMGITTSVFPPVAVLFKLGRPCSVPPFN